MVPNKRLGNACKNAISKWPVTVPTSANNKAVPAKEKATG